MKYSKKVPLAASVDSEGIDTHYPNNHYDIGSPSAGSLAPTAMSFSPRSQHCTTAEEHHPHPPRPPKQEGGTNTHNTPTKRATKTTKRNQKYFRLTLCSNLFFVLASIFYLWLAIEDLIWTQIAKEIPEIVLVADDDATWNLYYEYGPDTDQALIEQQQNQNNKLLLSSPSSTTTAPALAAAEVVVVVTTNNTNEDGSNRRRLFRGSNSSSGTRRRMLEEDSDVNWNDYAWEELPATIQEAASALGYNIILWNNSLDPYTNELWWNQLSIQQQQAATLFGYDEQKWNFGDENETASSNTTTTTDLDDYDYDYGAVVPTGGDDANTNANVDDEATTTTITSPTSNTIVSNADTTTALVNVEDFENLYWSQLLDDEKDAFQVLGYDQNIWNNGFDAATANVEWNFLTIAERQAAVSLGYTQATWDSAPLSNTTTWDDDTTPTTSSTVDAPAATAATNSASNNDNGSDIVITGSENTVFIDATPSTADLYWFELPQEAQNAASILGYDQNTWDNGLSVEADDYYWSQLTAQQQSAAAVLGYSQENWDGIDIDINSGASVTNGDTNNENSVIGSDNTKDIATTNTAAEETNYDDFYWLQLPKDIKDAASVLGYNQNSWDNGVPVEADDYYWSQLTPQQQIAATILGYSQEKWDGADAPATTSTTKQINYDNFSWAELPIAVQDAALYLGNNQNSWDNCVPVELDDYYWSQLNPQQQSAATILGYSQENWDIEEESCNKEAESNYEDYAWSALPPTIQQAASALGYNQESWDTSQTVYTSDLYWDQLSLDQQQAAIVLGYTKDGWNNYYTDFPYYRPMFDSSHLFQIGSLTDPYAYIVTREMVIYFCGALCFVITGILEVTRDTAGIFHFCLIFAGLTGLVSAVLSEKYTFASNLLNCTSVHFFLLEAIVLLRGRVSMTKQSSHNLNNIYDTTHLIIKESALHFYALWLADGTFFIGSLIDVVLSYFYFHVSSEWNTVIALFGIWAALFWIICSIIYTISTIVVMKQIQKEQRQLQELRRQQKKEKELDNQRKNTSPTNLQFEDEDHLFVVQATPVSKRHPGIEISTPDQINL